MKHRLGKQESRKIGIFIASQVRNMSNRRWSERSERNRRISMRQLSALQELNVTCCSAPPGLLGVVRCPPVLLRSTDGYSRCAPSTHGRLFLFARSAGLKRPYSSFRNGLIEQVGKILPRLDDIGDWWIVRKGRGNTQQKLFGVVF